MAAGDSGLSICSDALLMLGAKPISSFTEGTDEASIASPSTDQIEKAQYWQSVAVGSPGENGRGGYMRTAMNIDGQNQPTNSIKDFSLISVRG